MDGKTVTAYLRTSQSTELRFFLSGSVVINTCGGRLVSAPSSTKDNRVLCAIIPSNRSKHLLVKLIGEFAVERPRSIWIEPDTQDPNFLGHVVRTYR